MRIAVVGTGYVGLVTGVCLADIGHQVTCIDVDQAKVEKMWQGISPIYEPGLEALMKKNIANKRLFFTTKHAEGFANAEVIYIAVGTPEREDGAADLRYIVQAAKDIAHHITTDVIVVTKSTVPVGTNHYIHKLIREELAHNPHVQKRLAERKPTLHVQIVSNPEFLREGSAVQDTFQGDRIVLGTEDEEAARVMEEIYKPLNIPIMHTDIISAEMIKYASNAFLATKISFINEIANLCERVGANVEDVAIGMGQDSRIGSQFLRAGIGFGGSCFPKDTSALVQIARNLGHPFSLLEEVIHINHRQKNWMIEKLRARFDSLQGRRIAMLGLAFKPHTDDMREAASITIAQQLVEAGANVVAYDPIAMENAKLLLPTEVEYAASSQEAIQGADALCIVTEWPAFKNLDLAEVKASLKQPIVFDGRNCYELGEMEQAGLEYYSVGRPTVNAE